MALEPISGDIAYAVDTQPLMGLVETLRLLEKQSASLADTLGGSSADSAKAEKGIEAVDQKTRQAVVSTADLHKGLEQLRGVLGGVSDFLSSSTAAASEYNSVIAQIATLGPEAAAGTAQWKTEILEVSAAMGQDATTAANAVYDALSSGVPPDNVISFMEVASKAAVAGATDTGTAVKALSATLNAWKLDASEAGQVSDVFFTGVNAGVFRFEELASGIGQVAPLAASLGVTYQEVTAATATLTKSGLSASQAITQQRASMISLLTPNAQMNTVLGELAEKNADVKRTAEEQGISIAEAALKTMGYQGTLIAVADAADSAGVGLAQAMGSSEALGAVLGMTGENAKGAAADLEMMRQSGGATDGAFQKMSETYEMASKKLSAQFNAAMIEVGTTMGQLLVPLIQRGTEVLMSMLEGWRGLDDGTKKALVTIAAVVGVVGSGIGAFLSLQAAIAAVGPLFGAAGISVMGFGGAMAAIPILGIALAIGAVVKGMHDADAALSAAGKSAVEAGGSWQDYMASVTKARQEMGLLAQLASGGLVVKGLSMEAKNTRDAGMAWLEYGLGVNKAVVDSAEMVVATERLQRELSMGNITTDEFKARLVELADAESQAAGYGIVLTETQQSQAMAMALATSAALEKTGAVGEALVKDAEWSAMNDDLAGKVAQGKMTLDAYRVAINAYTAGRAEQIAADKQSSEATAQAAGKLQAYSSEFAKLSGAGSKWSADEQAMAAAVEESWTGLSGGVEKNLTEQWAARQKYDQDIAAAREADKQAAGKAAADREAAEAAHGEKLKDLNARMEDAKTDKQRESATKAIAKENEKLQGILAATDSVGGANVERVQQQYDAQVLIQQEALAQMVVDHVTNMVLMGQTSEDTAKTIFATLRSAYPGVEVFSPVADAHVHLMATIRDATDESSTSQVESIARLPDAMNGALGEIQTTAAEHNATVDSWATADELLAGRTEEASTRTGAASAAAADAVEASGSRANQSYDETGQVALAHAGTTEEAGARVGAAAATEADDLSAHHGRERASYDETGLAAGTYATKIGQESQRAATGVQTGAEGMKSGLQGVQRELDATSLKGAALAGNVTRNLGGLGTGIETSAKRGKAALSDLDQQLIRTSETSVRVGSAGEEGFGAGADAAEDAAGGITDATTDIGKGAEDATEMIVLLRKGLEELPPEIELLFTGIGLDDLIGDVRRLRLELDAMARAFGNAGNAAGSSRGGSSGGAKSGGNADSSGGANADLAAPPFDPWADFWGEQQDALEDLAREAGRSLEIPATIDDRTGGLFQDTGGRLALQDYLDALVGADYPVVVTPVLDEDTIIGQIDAARGEAERLLSVLQAQYDTFMRGGVAEDGSLAWLLANWQEIGQPADFAAMMTAMNVPVSTIAEFRAHWDALDPAGRADLWKRLYDDLRQMEKDRHDQTKANIEAETNAFYKAVLAATDPALHKITGEGGPLLDQIAQLKVLLKSYEGQEDKGNDTERAKAAMALLEAELERRKLIADEKEKLEDARHEQVMAGLEAENKLLGRQFDDWKAGMKAIADLEKQRDDARKAFAKAIRDEQKEVEEAEKGGHSLALQMLSDLQDAEEEKHDARMKWLDLEREGEDRRYKAQIDALKQLQADEDEAHERRMTALDDELKRARGPLDKLDAAMLQLKIDMAELKLDTSSLEHAKSMLDGLKAALSNLPDKPDRRRNPTGQVKLDEQARAALEDALASGKLSPEDARRAQRVLSGQKLGLEQMRALLERTAELNQETVSQEQSKLDAKQREIDMLQLQMDKEKLRYDQEALRIKALQDEENKLHDAEAKRLSAREQAEKDRHDRAVADIKAREDAEKAAWDAFEKRLDMAKRAEDERHQAKMRQIEAEFRARLIAEGLIEEAGKDPEEALRRAREIADRIFGALKNLVGSGSDEPPAEPAPPAQPGVTPDPNRQAKGQRGGAPPPGIPILPDPPRQVKGRPFGVGGTLDELAMFAPPSAVTDDTAPALLEFDAALEGVTMSLLELNAMMRAGSSSGDALLPGGVAGTGPTTYNSVANFYAPVIIPDDEDEALLLRQSLGAWGHRP